MKQREASIHQLVCDFLRYQYPDVIFRTDFAAGIKMTIGQAAKHKRMQGARAYPDLFIAHPRGNYHGAFLELKAENASPYLKNGQLSSNQHIQEQAAVLNALDLLGYFATFAVGYEEAISKIKQYLGARSNVDTPNNSPIF